MHPVASRIDVPAPLVAHVRELFEANRPLTALAATAAYPLERWPWGPPAVLAGRMLSWLGADRAAARLVMLNARHAPWHDEALLYRLFMLQDLRGVLAALHETERVLRGHAFADDPAIRYDVLGHQAQLLAVFRDFARASAAIDEAIAALPDRPWFPAIKAAVLTAADRREEAIEWADRALHIRPGYRLAVLRKADALIQIGRTDEAVHLLEEQHAATELAAYAGLLLSIASDRDDAPAALAALDEWRRRQPLLEKAGLAAYQAKRSDLLLLVGDLAGATEAAALSDSPFHKEVAARLAAPAAADLRRVRLDVPFVRQDHLTCAPATLAAVTAFWGRPFDQRTIAEKICYDGTPHFHQRSWAEQNGFAVAEFTVDYPVAKALIDAGLPFALSTTTATSSHLQAVIGYDDRNGVLIMRDPTSAHFTEAIAEPFLRRFAATGPHGMVMVPVDQAARLDAVPLPDRRLHDLLHALTAQLELHRRDEAGRTLDELVAAAPDHRITALARLCLAGYDADAGAEDRAIARLHAMFPDDQWATFTFYRIRSRTASHAESLALLDCVRLAKGADPAFELQRALLLAADAGQIDQAEKSFRRFLRFMPQDVAGLSGLADTLAARHRHADALGLRRLAATVDDTSEVAAGRYFAACLQLNRAAEGLDFLLARFAQYGTRSAGPAIAVFQAYEAIERRTEGFAVLEEARGLRPDDGLLQLFHADALGAVGRLSEARAALAEARSRVSRPQWLRRAAILAVRIEDNAAARRHWEDLLELSPLDIEALRAVVALTAEIDGVDAAVERLESLAARHPEFHPLRDLRSEWYLRLGRFAEAADDLRRISGDFPLAEWPYRSLAHVLSLQGKHADAIAAARQAIDRAPHLTYAHGQLGEVLAAARRFTDAAAAFRRSLELSIDNAASMRGLLESCADAGSRREAVAFLRRELVSQTTMGIGVLHFRAVARPHLEPAELLAILAEAREARPDLTETWTALTEELVDRGEFDAARVEAAAMLARFPHAAAAHRLRAVIEQRSGRLADAEAAWREGLRVVPGWTAAMRFLGEALEGLGRPDEAADVYRRAIACSPLEAANHGMLADVLWRTDRGTEALASVRRAVLADPDYEWGWQKLREWAETLGQPEAAVDAACELTRRRPREPRSWLIRAETDAAAGDLEAAAAAIEEGLAVAPTNVSLWDTKAVLLFDRGDLAGALAACGPPAFDGGVPRELCGRRFWVLLQAGQLDGAGAEIDAYLVQQPDYAFARFLRYDIHVRKREYPQARQQAEEMARLAPTDATAHGRVAATWIQEGRLEQAVPSLRRALALDPAYQFAVRHLLDQAIAARDVDEVERLLAHGRRFCPAEFSVRCEVVARAALGQKSLLAKPLAAYLQLGDVSADAADEVIAAALAGDPKPVRAALDKAVASGAVRSGAVVRAWVVRHRSAPARIAARLRAARLPAELAADGWEALLEHFDAATIGTLLVRYRRDYRTDRLWAAAGARLVSLGHRRAAGRWFADWQSHPTLGPQGLVDAIHAVEAWAGPIEAAAIRRRLMALPIPFRERYLHGVGLAWTEVREGNAAAARALLAGIDPETLVPYYAAIHHFTRVLLTVGAADLSAESRRAAVLDHWARAVAVCDAYDGDTGLRWYKRITALHASRHAEATTLARFARRSPWEWLQSWW